MVFDSDIISTIDSLVATMVPFIKIGSANTVDGITTVETSNTYWLTDLARVNVGETGSIQTLKVTEVLQNTSFKVEGVIIATDKVQLQQPYFYHGSHRKVNTEIEKLLDRPFVYLPVPKIVEDRDRNSSLAYSAFIRPLFLTGILDTRDKSTDFQQEKYINPMRAMADFFISQIDKSIDKFNDLTTVEEVENIDFGEIRNNSKVKHIFDDPLSGVQNMLTLEVFENSGCFRNITPVYAA